MPGDPSPARHPIAVAVRRTGLSADVIRAWERRYRAVRPDRSSTRRRLYSDADLERLRLLKRATENGRRIGEVAALDGSALADLVAADEAAGARDGPEPVPAPALAHLAACEAAVERLDPAALDRALAGARVALAVPRLLEDVVCPLLDRLGRRWREGSARVAHEHFASGTLRTFLGALLAAATPAEGPPVVVATLAGQRHELGALMAATIAAEGGWQPLYLGPSVPADEIAFAARSRGARAVLLGLCAPADDPRYGLELERLRAGLGPGAAVVAGGEGWRSHGSSVRRCAALPCADLAALARTLDALRAARPGPAPPGAP